MSESWDQLLAKSKGPWHTAAPDSRSKPREQDRTFRDDRAMPDMESTSDADVAQTFAMLQMKTLRYVPELKAWVFWDADKARWIVDVATDVAALHRLKLHMYALAQIKGPKAYQSALGAGKSDAEARDAQKSTEAGLKSTAKLKAVYTQVRAEPSMITSVRHFDADPWTLNTPAGAIDLWTGRTGDLSPAVLCMKQTAFAPKAGPAPLWEKVLSDAFPGDPDTQTYVETVLSMALVGDQAIQHFWMLSGAAGSGKGTIMNTVMSLLGTGETGYAMPVEAEFLMRQKGDKHPEQYARLKGKRLVVSSESSVKQEFDAARVKNITGDDIQSGRWMNGNTFSFKPTWKLFLMTNYRPRVDPEDGGFWRRFREIPFRHKPVEPIANLQSRLIEEEGPQILARLLERLKTFLEEGGSWTPEAVQQATTENQAEQDSVVEFLQERCEVVDDETVWASASDLHEQFVKWSRLNDYDSLTSTMFGRRLGKLGFASYRLKVNGKTIVVRRGLRLVQGSSLY